MKALERWTTAGLPDNPSAWLYRVAHNHLIGELRKQADRNKLLERNLVQHSENLDTSPEIFFEEEMPDELLRMLFACCDETIPTESQLVLALKILCGFSIREISFSLFTSEANVYKRFSRARNRLREETLRLEDLKSEYYSSRLPSVLKVLYLLFTEGHQSSHPELTIRRELCDEAIRLTSLLAQHAIGKAPEIFALLALMHLHIARLNTRQSASGGLLLLEEQDRTLWDQKTIHTGMEWLAKSATGSVFSRYHAEASIAAEHCIAPSFEETRWNKIAESYAMLEEIAPSPIHRLNRAVAVAEWQGPGAGLAILKDFDPPTWLIGSYLWSAVLADLHRRCGNAETAKRYSESAIKSAPTPAVQELLRRRLQIEDT